MSDTGAPWNLPYPLSTDLVRDGADAIKDLAEATATGLSAAGNAGIGSNVVQTVKTDTFSASVSTTSDSGDITGLTASITPSSDTSKVLVLVTLAATADGGSNEVYATLYRAGAKSDYIGDAAGSRQRVSTGSAGISSRTEIHTIAYLDSPNTASSVTYSVRLTAGAAATVFVNQDGSGTDTAQFARNASSITVIEVAV